MSTGQTDFELLRAFFRQGDQQAFADLTRRHLDLVYGTARRKVTDDGAAQEICQNVFGALARKAWQFAPDDSLPSWLHRTTLLESKSWWRGEMRRRRREEAAVELGTTMKTPDESPAFNALVPLLDEALLSLREPDRTALLLRYYETQSLRDVGATLGVGEDAAQKRVQSALEKLAGFFQRRGFKTATATAAAAALQHTATPASAATASAVVNAVFQISPPALGGVTAVLARLAGLTKVQVAAVCLTLAVLPVAWQWTENHAAARDLRQIQDQRSLTRNEQSALRSELERLHAATAPLENSLTAAVAASTQRIETARKFEAWKTHIRNLLRASDYRWPEDSPFVRIPKTAVTEIEVGLPVKPPGLIDPAARELLGLTAQERKSAEGALSNYFANLDRLTETSLYETNRPLRAPIPDAAIASKIFVLPPLGNEARQGVDHLLAELSQTLGPERWALAAPNLESSGIGTDTETLNLNADKDLRQVVTYIERQDQNEPTVTFQWHGKEGMRSSSGFGLANFLPSASSEAAALAAENLQAELFPATIARRLQSWLQQQAETLVQPELKR